MLFLPREEGQGLVEYALILVLVAIVVIVILALLGPAIGNIFSNIVSIIQCSTKAQREPSLHTGEGSCFCRVGPHCAGVSHFSPDFKPPRWPDLEPALKSVIACYDYLLIKLEEYGIQHGFPPSLKIYADKLYEQALIYSEKAYKETAQLEEKFY